MNLASVTPPYFHKDEEAVVGCLLLSPREVLPLVAPIVCGADFFDEDLGKLFDAAATLADAGKPVSNKFWLQGELSRFGVSEAAINDLGRLINQVPHWGHCTYHAEHVRDASRLRKMCLIVNGLAERSYDSASDPNQVLAWLESEVAALGIRAGDEPKPIGDVAGEAIEEIKSAMKSPAKPGIFTGIRRIDETTGPMLGGELIIPAARTGNGKTAFAMQSAIHAGEHGHGVLIVSLEMESRELIKRILAGRAGIDSRKLRAGAVSAAEVDLLVAERDGIKKLPVTLWAPPSATLAQIRAQARYLASRGNLRLLIVDYLGLVEPAPHERRMDRHLQVAAVSGGLKKLAKEIGVVVYALAQLNRQGEDEPRLTHLRESGAIEQDADAVFLLHIHEARSGASTSQASFREASCNVAKFRHGATGTVRLKWYPRTTEFRSGDE